MTRPTMPPGPPYPDDNNDPQESGQPRFTPRQSGPQPRQSGPQPRQSGPQPRQSGPKPRQSGPQPPYGPPTYQGLPPYGPPPPPRPARAGGARPRRGASSPAPPRPAEKTGRGRSTGAPGTGGHAPR